jgi:hypothetical protein
MLTRLISYSRRDCVLGTAVSGPGQKVCVPKTSCHVERQDCGQEHERGRTRLGQNDCLQGEKEIRKEISDLSYLHNIHKLTLFTKYASHLTIHSHSDELCRSARCSSRR